jgi:RHS repeat-associated protein
MDLGYNFNLGSSDNGNVLGITNNKDNTRSQVFTYDSLNRILTAETTSTHSSSPANCWSETYQYDNLTSGGAWGNLTSIGAGPSQYNGCVQESGLSITVNSNNQISTSGFTYDSAGNLTGNGSISLRYDAESRICSVGGTSCTTGTTYIYDGDGRRVEKTTSGSAYKLYWYNTSGNVLDETDGTGSTSNSNFNEYVFFGGKRIAKRNSSSVDYYFTDHLGTSRVLTDATGDIPPLDDSDFYPYGGERPVTGPSSGNTYKFTGKERDGTPLTETGFDYFGARYDSSQYGRFMTPDPSGALLVRALFPQRWNMYAYAINNPLSYNDPTGQDAAAVNFSGMVGGVGHEAVLIIGRDGSTTFASFGPMNHGPSDYFGAAGPGLLTVANSTTTSMSPLPTVQFGANGLPTADSAKALITSLANIENVDPSSVRINYFKTSDADTQTLRNYVDQEREAIAEGHGQFCQYNVMLTNCADFTVAALLTGSAITPQQVNSLSSLTPNGQTSEYSSIAYDSFDLIQIMMNQYGACVRASDSFGNTVSGCD